MTTRSVLKQLELAGVGIAFLSMVTAAGIADRPGAGFSGFIASVFAIALARRNTRQQCEKLLMTAGNSSNVYSFALRSHLAALWRWALVISLGMLFSGIGGGNPVGVGAIGFFGALFAILMPFSAFRKSKFGKFAAEEHRSDSQSPIGQPPIIEIRQPPIIEKPIRYGWIVFPFAYMLFVLVVVYDVTKQPPLGKSIVQQGGVKSVLSSASSPPLAQTPASGPPQMLTDEQMKGAIPLDSIDPSRLQAAPPPAAASTVQQSMTAEQRAQTITEQGSPPQTYGEILALAESGDARAQLSLGNLYRYGLGVPEDDAEAVKWFRKAAEQGNSQAQVNLAWLYGHGQGVPKDSAEAAKWYQMVYDKGDASLQFSLGYTYVDGRSVPKDSAQAAKWFRRAADQGLDLAQFELARMYASGDGVPKDSSQAAKWYRKAADQGFEYAQLDLGSMYHNGDGVPQNNVIAANWFRKAAEQGNVHAQFQLGSLYDSLFKSFSGNAQADNAGLPYDNSEAVKWYLKAAKQGDVSAELGLGLEYAFGVGVLKDEIEALAWLNLAAAAGNERAVGIRGTVEARAGREAALAAQQRSKELLSEIDAAKRVPGSTAAPHSASLVPPDGDAPKASGSGAIISTDGYVLTAAHVVAGANSLKIYTVQGLRNAKIVRIDEANDIAVLKLDGGTYPALQIALSRGVRLGQPVATIGFPNIEIQGFSPKVTKGEISSLSGAGDDPRLWQISVPVQPGNSGGALLDENGNLVGVVVSKLGIKAAQATGDIPQNVNYAVKSTYALALLEPYLNGNAPAPNQGGVGRRFEDMVAKAQQSAVLILVY